MHQVTIGLIDDDLVLWNEDGTDFHRENDSLFTYGNRMLSGGESRGNLEDLALIGGRIRWNDVLQ